MFFNDFLNEELELLISLPVRAGIWMSRADDVSTTDRDDKKEMLVLENVLKSIAGHKKAAPFVSELVKQTLDYKHVWDAWAGNDTEESFFKDVGIAMNLVSERLPEENILNYKNALYHVADTVAHAYDEHVGDGDDLREEMFLGGLVTRLMDRLDARIDMQNPENVSAAESAALQKLKTALKL